MTKIYRLSKLQCPFCKKHAKYPNVNIVIREDESFLICTTCMTELKTESKRAGEALIKWVDLVGKDYGMIVDNWVHKAAVRINDIDLFEALRGFGDEWYERHLDSCIRMERYRENKDM